MKILTDGLRPSTGTTCLYKVSILEQAAVLILFSLSSHLCNFKSHYGASSLGEERLLAAQDLQ